MSLSRELVAASATPLVLSIINRGENYGYAIIQEVRERSNSEIEWTDGMLYPVLRRLEKQGLLNSEWRACETGKKRRYYSIKPSGRTALIEHKRQWDLTSRVLHNLWEEAACLI